MSRQTEILPSTSCRSCPLWKPCKHPNIGPSGPKTSKVLFVGDYPGPNEDRIGEAFIGKEGRELDAGLIYAGLNREEILITNTCRCYPILNSDVKPKGAQISKCVNKHLIPLIKEVKPKLIVTLGAIALEAITGLTGIMKRQNVPIKSTRFNCKVLPLLHPARVVRNGDIDRKSFRRGLRSIKHFLETDESYYDYGEYKVLESIDEILEIYEYIKESGVLCFDIEATDLKFRLPETRMTALGLAVKERESFLIPFDGRWSEQELDVIFDNLKPIMASEDIKKIGQNIKFDSQFIEYQFGVRVNGWHSDTMLANFLLDERKGKHNLSDMTWKYLPELAGYDDEVKIAGGAHKVEGGNTLYTYCMADVDATFRLHNLFKRMLKKEEQWWFYQNVMIPAARVLSDMEYIGVKFDREHLEELQITYESMLRKIDAKMREDAGVLATERKFKEAFKPRGKLHTSYLLFDYYKLPVLGRTKKKNPSTNKDIIIKYAEVFKNPYCTLLQHYRVLDKMKSTYIDGILDKLPYDNVVHPSFRLENTTTGRTSSDSPNMQNLPRDKNFKNIVMARNGYYLLGADFAQAEIRVAAMVSGDDNLIALCNDIDKDFHKLMGAAGFRIPYEDVTKEIRQKAKSLSFGIIYLMGAKALAKTIGATEEEARRIIADLFTTYPILRAWINSTIRLVQKQQYVVSPFGRRRRFPKYYEHTEDWQRAAEEREAVNSIIQATSSDLMLITARRVADRLRGMLSHMLIEVHDSIFVEAHESEIEICVQIFKEEVPGCTKGLPWAERVIMKGDLEIGKKWGEMIEYDKWIRG